MGPTLFGVGCSTAGYEDQVRVIVECCFRWEVLETIIVKCCRQMAGADVERALARLHATGIGTHKMLCIISSDNPASP